MSCFRLFSSGAYTLCPTITENDRRALGKLQSCRRGLLSTSMIVGNGVLLTKTRPVPTGPFGDVSYNRIEASKAFRTHRAHTRPGLVSLCRLQLSLHANCPLELLFACSMQMPPKGSSQDPQKGIHPFPFPGSAQAQGTPGAQEGGTAGFR